LVTGHTGFKGGWLVAWLQRLGAEVAGLALDPPTTPSLFESAGLARGIESMRTDINDPRPTRDAMARVEPEIVFHLAAQSLVRISYEQPLTTLSTNVLGTAHVLDGVRATGSVRAVVVVTSDKCYENREWSTPYDETAPMGGHDPYSCSKGCAELVCAAYRRSFLAAAGVHLASARAGNVIGGGDWSRDRLIPDVVRSVLDGEVAIIRNPEAVRPWQHVLEPLSGYLQLAERLVRDGADFAEAWNFGPDAEMQVAVAEVVRRLADLWGAGARWCHQQDPSGPHEATSLLLDSTKARQRLGWRPVWGLDAALERTVEWYKAHAAGDDVRAVMEAQISDYTRGLETAVRSDRQADRSTAEGTTP
jgi:CDP-glucose 4,6-dehydratase